MKVTMKKWISLLLAGTMTMALAACGATSSSSTAATEGSSAPAASSTAASSEEASSAATEAGSLSGKIATGGSTSVEKVINALMEGYAELQPGVQITYEPTGSGAGITGVAEGTLDLGLSSRYLKDEEKEQGLVENVFALDGIALVVHSDNTVTDLTPEQIKGLATGEITNWSEVGGPDAPVVPIGREAGSGTRDGFESVIGVEDACKYQQELTSTGAVISAVASNPNAFGYASLAAVGDTVKVVSVSGVTPSVETVQDGSYVLQRPFVMVTKEGTELSEQAQNFLDFATSADAASLIELGDAVAPQK